MRDDVEEKFVLETIERVVSRLAPKYIFGYYELEDIKQEGRILALEALPRWDGVRPLENFLHSHVHNRLGNLKRDKFKRNEPPCAECFEGDGLQCHGGAGFCKRHLEWEARNEAKAALVRPGAAEPDSPPSAGDFGPGELAELGEYLALIDEKLDLDLREDYLKMRAGVKLSPQRRAIIEGAIIEIIGGAT